MAETYHLWEKVSWPMMKHVSRLHRNIFQGTDQWFIPLANRQDLKCSYLAEKNRKTLASFEITEDQYATISGQPPRIFSTEERQNQE